MRKIRTLSQSAIAEAINIVPLSNSARLFSGNVIIYLTATLDSSGRDIAKPIVLPFQVWVGNLFRGFHKQLLDLSIIICILVDLLLR